MKRLLWLAIIGLFLVFAPTASMAANESFEKYPSRAVECAENTCFTLIGGLGYYIAPTFGYENAIALEAGIEVSTPHTIFSLGGTWDDGDKTTTPASSVVGGAGFYLTSTRKLTRSGFVRYGFAGARGIYSLQDKPGGSKDASGYSIVTGYNFGRAEVTGSYFDRPDDPDKMRGYSLGARFPFGDSGQLERFVGGITWTNGTFYQKDGPLKGDREGGQFLFDIVYRLPVRFH